MAGKKNSGGKSSSVRKKGELKPTEKQLGSKKIDHRFTAMAVIVVLLAVAATQFDAARQLLNLDFIIGPKSSGASDLGFFPPGCRWRTLPSAKQSGFWDVAAYEYWDEDENRWSEVQPAACRLPKPPLPTNYRLANNSQTSSSCNGRYCLIENVWYNQGRFYYLTDEANGTVRCNFLSFFFLLLNKYMKMHCCFIYFCRILCP